MMGARRTGSVVAFPELAAARERRARREAASGLVMLAIVAAFVALAVLVLGLLVRGITWAGAAIWDHVPGFAPSREAIVGLLAQLVG
jgi:hypothetical protein